MSALPADLSCSAEPRPPARCLVALCHNWPIVWTESARSLMEIGWGDRVARARQECGFDEISFAWFKHFPRVDALRDAAAETAIENGFTHLLYLDADMKWPTDVLVTMLRHKDAGIVSGLYVLKAPPYAPVALRDRFVAPGSRVNQFFHDHDYRETGDALRDEDVVGMGCTLVPVSVFSAIGPRPWFQYGDDDEGWPAVTEDVLFCLKAKEAGYAIRLDPSVRCVHVGTQMFDDRWAKRYQESFVASNEMLQDKLKITVIRPSDRKEPAGGDDHA